TYTKISDKYVAFPNIDCNFPLFSYINRFLLFHTAGSHSHSHSDFSFTVCLCVCLCVWLMEKDEGCCYFHPDEVFVGVCPSCLYERLIVVAGKRCRRLGLYRSGSCKSSKPRIILPKMFAIDSLIHRKTKKHHLNNDASDGKRKHMEYEGDRRYGRKGGWIVGANSFISIRFDRNSSVGAWEKGKVSLKDCNNEKSVVEHAKPPWSSMRWRKRIGHVFQLMTWKKSSRHVGSGRRMAKGNQWIKHLTRRKTE
ncbi:Uncharacterized protein family UPF0503, partial [Cynara cardunculus var. scolymus]